MGISLGGGDTHLGVQMGIIFCDCALSFLCHLPYLPVPSSCAVLHRIAFSLAIFCMFFCCVVSLHRITCLIYSHSFSSHVPPPPRLSLSLSLSLSLYISLSLSVSCSHSRSASLSLSLSLPLSLSISLSLLCVSAPAWTLVGSSNASRSSRFMVE